jgi:hypothetical protein
MTFDALVIGAGPAGATAQTSAAPQIDSNQNAPWAIWIIVLSLKTANTPVTAKK